MKKIEFEIKIPSQQLSASFILDDDFPEWAIQAKKLDILSKLLQNVTYEVVSDEIKESN